MKNLIPFLLLFLLFSCKKIEYPYTMSNSSIINVGEMQFYSNGVQIEGASDFITKSEFMNMESLLPSEIIFHSEEKATFMHTGGLSPLVNGIFDNIDYTLENNNYTFIIDDGSGEDMIIEGTGDEDEIVLDMDTSVEYYSQPFGGFTISGGNFYRIEAFQTNLSELTEKDTIAFIPFQVKLTKN